MTLTSSLLITTDTGEVGVMQLTDGCDLNDALSKLAESLNWRIMSVDEINMAEVPVDKYFREAWRGENGKIVVDMEKAREIHMGRIRIVRNLLLSTTDVDFLRSVEIADVQEQKMIAAKRDFLRNIPQTFDLSNASTVQELIMLWPKELNTPKEVKLLQDGITRTD